MAIRTFVFCDVCNGQGIRYIEQRRSSERSDAGNRVTDGRAWFEGDLDAALQHGWVVSDSDTHVCPRCVARFKQNPKLQTR